MSEKAITIEITQGIYGVCRLSKEQAIPKWAIDSPFFSITKTLDELSIVCPQNNIPSDIKCERDWKVLKVLGPLDFSLIGILASISGALAKKGVSIFAISTFDTDYILVKESSLANAIEALRQEGYSIC